MHTLADECTSDQGDLQMADHLRTSGSGVSAHRRHAVPVVVALLALLATACQPGLTLSFAGSGSSGTSGDGGPATAATFQNPAGVVAIPGGGFYVADNSACTIRKVSATGVVSLTAGNGTCGNTGDGGAATSAEISFPSVPAITVAGGALWFIQGSTNQPRKVAADGTISTPALGLSPFTGGLTSDPSGAVYTDSVDPSTLVTTISKIDATGTRSTLTAYSGFGADLAFVSPTEMAVSGFGGVISRLDTTTGTLTPTGVTAASFGQIAATPDGTIYATSSDGLHVLRIDPANAVTTIAGNGTDGQTAPAQVGLGTDLALTPEGLAVTPHQGLLISSGHVVYRLDDPAHAG